MEHDENAFNDGRPTADGQHEGKMAHKIDENAFMKKIVATTLSAVSRSVSGSGGTWPT